MLFSIYTNGIACGLQTSMKERKETNGRKKAPHEHPLFVHCRQNIAHIHEQKNRYVTNNCQFSLKRIGKKENQTKHNKIY